MEPTPKSVKLLQTAVSMAVMYVAIQLAIHGGIEAKSWWQLSWEFIAGGSIGAAAAVLFFVVFGAIGWVSGALFGTIGLVGLMAGGALGGLGLGALVHLVRNPPHYNFHWLTIFVTLAVGLVLACVLSSLIGRRFVRTTTARPQSPESKQ
jgi:hypothetical protein